MPLLLALLFAAKAQAAEPFWRLGDALSISGVARGGRIPFPQDEVLGVLADQGMEHRFALGDTLPSRNGAARTWVAVKSNAKGELNQPRAGYIQAIVSSDSDRDAILTVVGDGMLYWNGAPRPGDVYGYGYLSLPVHVRKGENTLLVASGRGQLTARLEAPKAPQQFNLADTTLPDVLTTDKGSLAGAVVVLNSTDTPAESLSIQASVDGHVFESRLPTVPPYSLRKVPFQIPVVTGKAGTTQHVGLELIGSNGQEEDRGTVDVNLVDPFTTHKRTFLSSIDGSLQYYAVVPAKRPSKSNALVLTLHGAGVEAIGQARAYQAKDWCTIVAPTNRRPYGFDWEDTGRMDALEVLDIAKRTYPHDPARVVLTGHSMGGHGTWSIGTLYPNLFAAIAPSAGWVSFQSYAGGFRPTNPDPTEELFLEAAAPSDTLGRIRNTLEEKTYILHGDADDNVPVTEARTMKKALTAIGADFIYHEQPGAGHWWGNQCVDWPPLFAMLQEARLRPVDDPAPIDFTTPDPQVSSTLRWITIERQQLPGISSVKAEVAHGVLSVTTKNVAALEIRKPNAEVDSVVLDGADVPGAQFPVRLSMRHAATTGVEKTVWEVLHSWNPANKDPLRSGGLKEAFQHDMVVVVGTHGDDANRLWASARYFAEGLYYRGNGALDILTDTEYLARRRRGGQFRDRNVLLFGNADSNSAWSELLRNCPIQVKKDGVSVPKDPSLKLANGGKLAAIFAYPLPGSRTGMVAAFGVTGPAGIAVLERLPVMPSGTAFPDWTILNPTTAPTSGVVGVVAAGDFGPDWRLRDGDIAQR